MPKELHVFGVRHHGPGSARAVLRALGQVGPDCVLIEGPTDANELIAQVADEGLRPPVAILIYQADDPAQAVFYPFAEFSPEWCAMRWALEKHVPVRFMDLPHSHRPRAAEPQTPVDGQDARLTDKTGTLTAPEPPSPEQLEQLRLRLDPLLELARAAGFDDGERWWEFMFEHRKTGDIEVFTAIGEAMYALRERQTAACAPSGTQLASAMLDREEPLREAWMRRTIREAQREFQKIAVVCGAWHVPALAEDKLKNLKKEDDAQLRPLVKVKSASTWIPWTYDRLAAGSGYGAGVRAPGWYEHVWRSQSLLLESWMTRVGRFLREQELDCSSAHVIEATRLATSLAAMRNRPLADLSDIADACRAVFCFDSDLGMQLIASKLLIGQRLGEVPEETPLVPLQQDLQRQQKRLRLKPEALEKSLDLDLRNETDLARSELLHRLRILGIAWGDSQVGHGGKGTFHELWKLRWEPTFLVRLIELGAWGNTIEAAAAAYTMHLAERADLEKLTTLLKGVILANLAAAVESLLERVLTTAAVAADVAMLMDAFPPLAQVFRYGNVRGTDQTLVRRAIDGVLPRIVVGLGSAVSSLNDEAAREMHHRIVRVHEAVQLLESPAETDDYLQSLATIADQPSAHGLLRGRCTRLLFDYNKFDGPTVATRLSLTLSRGGDPAQAAAWVEGFLSSSGLVLLHHADLLELIDRWIGSISNEVFQEQVPLLRRTFSTFPAAERRQIGELLCGRLADAKRPASAPMELNVERARRVLPVLRTIFGTAPTGESA